VCIDTFSVVQNQRLVIERRLLHISYALLTSVIIIVLWALLLNSGKRHRTQSASDVSSFSAVTIEFCFCVKLSSS